jgi:hypothetical protein
MTDYLTDYLKAKELADHAGKKVVKSLVTGIVLTLAGLAGAVAAPHLVVPAVIIKAALGGCTIAGVCALYAGIYYDVMETKYLSRAHSIARKPLTP